ncbi:hypothetical protein NDU88_006605 [Pleurodeles waltl]|uniref:Uncharacterized protein n=1 Tax=Pleurodeles waltl TaxID=8319 RepID=A0AAV7WDZ9_PLEWA|nr:hypothetical protein NDU88_006605 [Pleurodeles waltl]
MPERGAPRAGSNRGLRRGHPPAPRASLIPLGALGSVRPDCGHNSRYSLQAVRCPARRAGLRSRFLETPEGATTERTTGSGSPWSRVTSGVLLPPRRPRHREGEVRTASPPFPHVEEVLTARHVLICRGLTRDLRGSPEARRRDAVGHTRHSETTGGPLADNRH